VNRLLLLGAAGVLASALNAQSGLTAAGDFTAERVVTLASASAPNPPSFPADVLAALQAGRFSEATAPLRSSFHEAAPIRALE